MLLVRQHPDFETWRQKGKISAVVVKQLCEPLKTDPRFTGQPARFYTSAVTTVNYIYKSWLALMKRSQAKEIVAITQKYSATSIVLPKLEGMREQLNSEIQAKAEEKCPS